MFRIRGKIVGASAINFNKKTERAAKSIATGSAGVRLSDKEKRLECEEKVHRNGKGLVIPTFMFKSTIVEGCKLSELKKNRKALWPYLEGAMFVESDLHLNRENFDTIYESDVIKKDGTMVHVMYPQVVLAWEAEFVLLIASDLLSAEDIKTSTMSAGLFKGMGANRRHGYGKFNLESFEMERT